MLMQTGPGEHLPVSEATRDDKQFKNSDILSLSGEQKDRPKRVYPLFKKDQGQRLRMEDKKHEETKPGLALTLHN